MSKRIEIVSAMKIAVSGKGGVGKTLVAGAVACILARKGLKTIAIDADPSPNLALTLGLDPEEANEILPISENKELVESKTNTGVSGIYRLTFTVDDIVKDFSVETPCNVNLIVMGTVRSMGSGCTCAANAVIRTLLRHLVIERDEAIVLDMEAGVEHLGRGTAKEVDTMLIIVDSSIKSLEIAKRINKLAKDAGIQQVFLVGNKVANQPQEEAITKFADENQLEILESIPFDNQVAEAEMMGETPIKNVNSEAMKRIENLGHKLLEVATTND